MRRIPVITAMAALVSLAGAAAAPDPAQARMRVLDERVFVVAQQQGPGFERYRGSNPPNFVPPSYGGRPAAPSLRRTDPAPAAPTRAGQPLPDSQIWGIVQRTVSGRIVNAHLHGQVYSFRIISNRGNIVDVDVDRYSGRVVGMRGGP